MDDLNLMFSGRKLLQFSRRYLLNLAVEAGNGCEQLRDAVAVTKLEGETVEWKDDEEEYRKI